MSVWGKIFWVLVAATFAVYAVLGYASGIILRRMSNGLPSFDFRATGYTHSEAQDFIYALTTGGTDYYLGDVQRLDTVFPAMLTLVLVIAIYHLMRGRARAWQIVLAASPLAYAWFDYRENGLVRQMLQFNAEQLPVDLVSLANSATIMKYSTLGFSVLVLIILLVKRRRTRS